MVSRGSGLGQLKLVHGWSWVGVCGERFDAHGFGGLCALFCMGCSHGLHRFLWARSGHRKVGLGSGRAGHGLGSVGWGCIGRGKNYI